MALTGTERENLIKALFVEGLNPEQARGRHPSSDACYAWQTVKRVKTWFETLPIEEAQHLQDEDVRLAYERQHGAYLPGVHLLEADGTSDLGLVGYLRGVRREIAGLSTEALDEAVRSREKYAVFERKRSPWPPPSFIPWQRSWSLRGRARALFVAEHCPQLVEAYDAFGEEEAILYQLMIDELRRPSEEKEDRQTVQAAAQRYERKRKLLLAVLDRLCEADELPGKCPFCPDHAI